VPEVYGTPFIEAARDLLVARITALKTDLIGYSPAITSVHEKHTVADLRPWDVSVALSESTATRDGFEQALGTGIVIDWTMEFTVRVHACYGDEQPDLLSVERLLNSIASKLAQQVNLTAINTDPCYRIIGLSDIRVNERFEESDSRGGTLTVTVDAKIEHTQE
jgi:hypothetical protein